MAVEKRSFVGTCSLCLLKEKEVSLFLKELETDHTKISLESSLGSLHITLSSDQPIEPLVNQIAKRFPDYFLGNETIQEAIHREMTARKKTLGLAESCTGGAIGARLVTVPGASSFFSGSIVAYSNEWKQRFLGLKRDTLSQKGAVSLETVQQMVIGLFAETNIDYAVAVSGTAGPSGGDEKKPVGTIYIAVAKRGEKIDAGRIMSSLDRLQSIELTLQTALGALWRRVAHNTFTLS
jgi:nicotinamide-nucleotide amidase